MDAGALLDPLTLRGLDGALTAVQYLNSGGVGSGGGFANHNNTGDFALLLNDFSDVGWSNQGQDFEVDYHFTGFQPGRYKIYTYAVDPRGTRLNTSVIVPGADDPVKFVTGPMPGNQFIEGVTHSVHDLTLSGDSFEIQVHGSPPYEYDAVNGFQIVAVPEPMSGLVLVGGLALLLRHKRPAPHKALN